MHITVHVFMLTQIQKKTIKVNVNTNTKYKYNSYYYCAPYSLTDGALQKSANMCFTAVGRLK